MSVRHAVNRGDSLWSLAYRYLGSGKRWPDILQHHNEEAAKFGSYSRLLAIKDPNLIYVGQTIIIPLRSRNPAPGTGKKIDASTIATGLGLKLEYNFESGKNPIKYKPKVTKDYTITSEMTGKITIENLTHNGDRHNFEIAMTVNKSELTSKLEFGDKALAELTKSVELQFDMASGKVTLKASIAAHANIGPYKFEVKADAPNHFTCTFKPQPISATVENNKRRYKYSAEIAFKVDITLHPTPRNKRLQTNPDAVRERVPGDSRDSRTPLMVIGIIAASILILIYGPTILIPRYAPALNMPFIHHINPNDPRLQT